MQLVVQVKQALRVGLLRPGDQLPKVRDVAQALAINPNTVLKAYRELVLEGLAEGKPGVGTFVTGSLAGPSLGSQAQLRDELVGWLERGGGGGGRGGGGGGGRRHAGRGARHTPPRRAAGVPHELG